MQLEMKCKRKRLARRTFILAILSATDLEYQVCTQPDLRVPPRPHFYLFVDIENPILWIRISFDFALIFNCSPVPVLHPFRFPLPSNNNFCQVLLASVHPCLANCLLFDLQSRGPRPGSNHCSLVFFLIL